MEANRRVGIQDAGIACTTCKHVFKQRLSYEHELKNDSTTVYRCRISGEIVYSDCNPEYDGCSRVIECEAREYLAWGVPCL